MAPRTIGGLTHRMAHGGHILHEHYEFIDTKVPVPAFAFNHGLNLRSGDMDPMVYGGHIVETTLHGRITGVHLHRGSRTFTHH